MIAGAPGGILCAQGLDCVQQFRARQSVQLTAYPNPGSVFTGWTGDCLGTSASCTVTMDKARAVTANFK